MSMRQGQGAVAIVGAGLTGCLLACYLSRRGYRVDVYERRPDPRAEGAERGRSINLALSERGLDALRRIGLADEVMAPALPMRGRVMHDIQGALSFQPYSADSARAINSIGRSALNETLLDAAEASAGVAIHFEHRLVGLDVEGPLIRLDGPGGQVEARPDVVIGADGWRSAVREALEQGRLVQVRTDMIDDGYKELSIPPTADGQFALDPGALHIWPRGRSMMIALPNPDRTFTCTLFWPLEGPDSFASVDADGILAHFRRAYPDAVPLMPRLVEEYRDNPVGRLGTVHVAPWQVAGTVALVGDSAHAILPFFGQGANCGFEDVVELDRCLEETGDSWPEALPLYQKRRIDNAEAIAMMAQENFIEMRDKVGSRAFLVGKKVEHALERALPGRYLSRYEMVSFTTIPYAEVVRRSRLQSRAVIATAGALSVGVAALGAVAARAVRR